ncbi:ABC transporter substrate-binding protein [Arthrobacter sp. Sa2CUA1]|uniref:ABC transporter substrate-binding protein n=1 Tax=Arthrobacter gallicola TaxID=2762225 RepID=A0ABR8UV07_9MICC|nr:ABC transporter substrate-binding protein [Arthrobacter gallicola]MBD7996210.1 ABC transporter substrate-binding protein [Arthrobacter gallicola]
MSTKLMKSNRFLTVAALALACTLGVSACAPSSVAGGEVQEDVRDEIELQADETADGFDLDELIAAAKEEGPITIYDETGKVTQIAAAFTEKYGIKAEGVKIEANAIDKVKRESESGNIIADVLAISEPPALYAELLRDGLITNWVPGDVYDKLPEEARYPYLSSVSWLWWSYSPEAYGDKCPVTNIWEMTDEEWKGRVALPDPEARAMYTNIWNQSARDHEDAWAAAYEEHYGKAYESDQETAFHAWLKGLAENSPVVFKSDEEVSEAVGAPGQTDPPIGAMSGAKYRNNAEKGYSLAPCTGLDPYVAGPMPQTMGYVTKSESPNAAKLYIHFASSQEGMEFIMGDGKRSYNPDVVPDEDPHGLEDLIGDTQPFSTNYLEDDFQNTVTWQDFWRQNR